jgi:uncharacterized metal-binding protein
MPSGKTHDAITWLAAVPAAAAAWFVTGSLLLAAVVTGATLFGGLMFGPDLDIHSRQYTRWGPLRFIWWPYKVVFRHRSRLTHGIVLGTLIRVLYFAGMLALLAAAAFYLYMTYAVGQPPTPAEFAASVRGFEIGLRWDGAFKQLSLAAFAGLWWGAATHTLADVVWSMLRKGSELF